MTTDIDERPPCIFKSNNSTDVLLRILGNAYLGERAFDFIAYATISCYITAKAILLEDNHNKVSLSAS